MITVQLALKVVVAIVLLASTPLALKRRWRLFLAIPLSVVQGFVPWVQIAGVPVPIAFWGGLMLWPELVREFRNVVAWKPTAYICGIVILYIVSLLWSPDPKIGLQPIGYFLEFLVIFAAVVTEWRRDEKLVLRLLAVTVTLALLQASAVAAFYMMPGVKLAYLTSNISKWFISPNTIDHLFTTAQNNGVSPGKSGGLNDTNANAAATYLGVVAFIAIGLALQLRRRWLGLVGLMLLGAVAFTGSKAGLMLAVALPILALQAMSKRYRGLRNRLRIAMVGIAVVGGLAWLLPKAIQASESGSYRELAGFFQQSDMTLDLREKIWGYGAKAFAQQPFLGQGFGGWQAGFPRYARKVGIGLHFPPHNTIIYLWSQGGLLAALLGLAFIYRILRYGWQEMRNPLSPAFGLHLAMTLAFLWVFVQGMGENFGLIGGVHTSPLLAYILALSYVSRRSRPLAYPARQSSGYGELNGEPASEQLLQRSGES
jgi:O-antigen ligase